MYDKKCLIEIKNRYNSLTKTEKRIADYILSYSDKVIFSSAADIAEKTDTVKSAVVRFCKSIGFDGYNELKVALAMDLSKNKELNFTPYIHPDDEADEILDKVFAANVKTLHDTAEKIDRNALRRAVELIRNARNVYIYGIGTSSALVNDFQYRLMQLGISVLCFTDVPTMKISTMNLKEGDVAIGISHSGRTVATVDALSLAKKQGADTVCVTSYPHSSITKVSDCAITVYSDEVQYPVEAVSARISQISVLDTIAVSLSAKNYDDTLSRSKKTRELINTIRYSE